ncbi:hypothetical protein [Novosphingobium sp. 9]|uniref:hypothetical protein n=1 Tax=Novosphingobium sp. 9 TaxID=2025349 RepID=UPI0021B55E3A|nr:hypothetical protein [Novosphingobium sp. 9]
MTIFAAVSGSDAAAQEGPQREGQPGVTAGWSSPPGTREGLPATLDAPYAPPRRDGSEGFSFAYARVHSPRVAVFWNRVLTDEIETGREDVTTFSLHGSGTEAADLDTRGTRRGTHSRLDARTERDVDATLRSVTNRLDNARRDTPFSEAVDFDLERGFMQGLADAGVKLVDRTTIVRAAALDGDTANGQAVEMKALLGRADWVVEVTPLARAEGDSAFKVVVRDLRSGSVIAMTSSEGQPSAGPMPYVAGAAGFVRATPEPATPLAAGRQVAIDTLRAIARNVR